METLFAKRQGLSFRQERYPGLPEGWRRNGAFDWPVALVTTEKTQGNPFLQLPTLSPSPGGQNFVILLSPQRHFSLM